MTSPGVKRQLDFDLPAHTSGSGGTTNPNLPVANGGNKRRCTNQFQTHHHQQQQQSRYDNIAGHTNSPFKDSSTILAPMGDDIAAVIKDEMHRAHDNHTVNGDEVTIFTARQTQFICEKLIRDREQKLRDEYDRILASKLAEQYDLLLKANFINPYATDCSRLPNAATAAANAAAALSQPAGGPSINALAAAFTSMQRSAAHANVANTTSLRDLSTFATSLASNGHPSALTPSHLHAFNLQQQAAAAAALQAQQQQRVGSTNSSLIPSGPVLLASNLDEQLAVPEALFTLFGVFGDVIRVKILFNKKDNALIQMADANQAQVAQGYLDKQKIFGKAIRVTRSKHQLVQMPREGNQSDAGLTKDFTNSPLHRFKIPGSRNYLNIYPPSNTLHISNIPATIDEDGLHKAFKEACGFEFSSFKFFPKDRKMAIMRFNSIEHAAIALIKMHNFQISDDNTLRVSFSKSIMQQ